METTTIRTMHKIDAAVYDKAVSEIESDCHAIGLYTKSIVAKLQRGDVSEARIDAVFMDALADLARKRIQRIERMREAGE